MEWLITHSTDPRVDEDFTPDEITRIRAELRPAGPPSTTAPLPTASSAPAPAPAGPAASSSASVSQETINRAIDAGVCTYSVSGSNFVNQSWHYCFTCGLVGTEGVCGACAKTCHKGHNVSEAMRSTAFYCDCGAGAKGLKCKSLKPGWK